MYVHICRIHLLDLPKYFNSINNTNFISVLLYLAVYYSDLILNVIKYFLEALLKSQDA